MRYNPRTYGYVMLVVGFLVIVQNAMLYLLHQDTMPTMLIIGMVLVATGLLLARKGPVSARS